MNGSGSSVRLAALLSNPLKSILVAHDEMAFTPGTVRIKLGGANGHNGLRSLFTELSNNREFYRLRIGVGHPGDASKRLHLILPDTRFPQTSNYQLPMRLIFTYFNE